MSAMYYLISVNHVFDRTTHELRLDSANIIMESPCISELKDTMHAMFLTALDIPFLCELNKVRKDSQEKWRGTPQESETLEYVYFSAPDELTQCEVCIASSMRFDFFKTDSLEEIIEFAKSQA